MYRIGFDVGGTFTDFTLLDEASGAVHHFKIASTPRDLADGIAAGVTALMQQHNIAGGDIRFVGHGTTVATNMVIERRGAATGLITTKGFRDVLEIGRQTRPHLYDYSKTKPPPLVPRHLRHEVPERVLADGTVAMPLDEEAVAEAAKALAAAGVDAVAICFLHCYRRPEHEARAAEIARRYLPNAYFSLSSEVLPEFREFERLSTTVLNGYIGPRMSRYLAAFRGRLVELGIETAPYTIHSNGGLMSLESVRRFPVRTCLSGPAAGVVGAAHVGAEAGYPNLVTFDVGGTSTDVSLIHDGRPLFTSDRLVADYPVKTPMLDIHVIGAGGGSIAWIDDAGAVKVGPRSAGAEPGPAAYGKGGTAATITDANICLGRLNPVVLLGGRMPVDRAAASGAVMDNLATPLDLPLETAAHGILRIAIANMSRAIRAVSTERGHDIGQFALFAYGGAGPLHASEIARACGLPTVIVPEAPGTMCARGMLLSDINLDFVQSEITIADAGSWQRIAALYEQMETTGRDWLAGEGVAPENCAFRALIDARYQGQNYEVAVAMDGSAERSLAAFLDGFRDNHVRTHGYDIPDRPVEIVNCRLQAIGHVPRPKARAHAGTGTLTDAEIARRPVYFDDATGWRETPVYDRLALPAGVAFAGPAVIEEMSATTIVFPGDAARLDAVGNIVIDVQRVEARSR